MYLIECSHGNVISDMYGLTRLWLRPEDNFNPVGVMSHQSQLSYPATLTSSKNVWYPCTPTKRVRKRVSASLPGRHRTLMCLSGAVSITAPSRRVRWEKHLPGMCVQFSVWILSLFRNLSQLSHFLCPPSPVFKNTAYSLKSQCAVFYFQVV